MRRPYGAYDVVVIGLGALGSATCWQLARRGVRVLGLERFELLHTWGASHGEHRVVRLAHHSPNHISAAIAAAADWTQLEADAGRSLMLRCGGVDLFPPGSAVAVEDYVDSMTAMAVPYEVLTASVARARWPGLAVPEGTTVVYQDRAGIVPATSTVAVMQEQARRFGARLFDLQDVVELVDLGEGVVLRTADASRVTARRVVVCADAWTNRVLSTLDVALPLTVTGEQAVHFRIGDCGPDGLGGWHAPGTFPVWNWMDDPAFYGLPTWGSARITVGRVRGGPTINPDRPPRRVDEESLQRIRALVRVLVPAAEDVVDVTRCLSAVTPDQDFVLDVVPGHERVAVGLGGRHGFTFAPWFGRVLADLAVHGRTDTDLSAFSLTRRALTDAVPLSTAVISPAAAPARRP